MNFFVKLFKKKQKTAITPMPCWEAVIELLYDKHLDAFSDKVVEVIYSKDRSMRYVVLKENNGLLTYQLEAIYQFDEDDWRYICSNDNALPAMWEPFRGIVGKSFFESMEELREEIENEPEFKQYF
jgi:hypothetical protein